MSTPVALSIVKLDASSPDKAKVNAVLLSSTPVKVRPAAEFSSNEEEDINKSLGALLLAALVAKVVTAVLSVRVIAPAVDVCDAVNTWLAENLQPEINPSWHSMLDLYQLNC